MRNLSKIETGDIGFVYSAFNVKDINTYMSWFTRFFMNFQAFFLGKEKNTESALRHIRLD